MYVLISPLWFWPWRVNEPIRLIKKLRTRSSAQSSIWVTWKGTLCTLCLREVERYGYGMEKRTIGKQRSSPKLLWVSMGLGGAERQNPGPRGKKCQRLHHSKGWVSRALLIEQKRIAFCVHQLQMSATNASRRSWERTRPTSAADTEHPLGSGLKVRASDGSRTPFPFPCRVIEIPSWFCPHIQPTTTRDCQVCRDSGNNRVK